MAYIHTYIIKSAVRIYYSDISIIYTINDPVYYFAIKVYYDE